MDIDRLSFTKNWTNSQDFPTMETNETKVRADMQLLYDEILNYLNLTLSPSVEEAFEKVYTEYATKAELDGLVIGVSPDLAATEAVLAKL